MRPAFNFEPKYRVTMLTQEDWTKGTGTPPVVKRACLVYRWVQDEGGDRGWSLWAICGKRLSFSLGIYATVFQAEIYAILACVYEIQFQSRPEKYVSICSDSQVALKALQAIRTSPLVQQCQKLLNDISTQHAVELYWSLDILGCEVMRLPMRSQGTALF